MNKEQYEEYKAILAGAPETAIAYCEYDYDELDHGLYLNCKNEFFDDEEYLWVPMKLVDNYFHSFRRISDIRELCAMYEAMEGFRRMVREASGAIEREDDSSLYDAINILESPVSEFMQIGGE